MRATIDITVEGCRCVFAHVRRSQMVDGTPILDIKPYLPWYDAPNTPLVYPKWVEDARQRTLEVEILPDAEKEIEQLGKIWRGMECGDGNG